MTRLNGAKITIKIVKSNSKSKIVNLENLLRFFLRIILETLKKFFGICHNLVKLVNQKSWFIYNLRIKFFNNFFLNLKNQPMIDVTMLVFHQAKFRIDLSFQLN
jgi:hypothetical protein